MSEKDELIEYINAIDSEVFSMWLPRQYWVWLAERLSTRHRQEVNPLLEPYRRPHWRESAMANIAGAQDYNTTVKLEGNRWYVYHGWYVYFDPHDKCIYLDEYDKVDFKKIDMLMLL